MAAGYAPYRGVLAQREILNMRRAIIRRARRWLYLGHRWIGISTCLLVAMWFVSGLVMIYAGFPNLTDRERLQALPDIAWDTVKIAPDRAIAVAGAARYPRDLRLNMLIDEPVYRHIDWDGLRQTISAVDGRAIKGITLEQALAVARRHPAAADVRFDSVVDRDQWSVTARFDPLRPFFLIALGDTAGTQLYVSEQSGEIALDTTRSERIWNWVGAIPHWIYPTVLRKDGALWRQVVLWISGACIPVAISGMWIGILRVRFRQRYPSGRITPYRGWMGWHHMTGVFSGMFVLSWIFSGWLSLNPGELFSDRSPPPEMMHRYAGHDAPDFAAEFRSPQIAAVETRFVWLGGKPLMWLAGHDGQLLVADPITGVMRALSDEEIFVAARHLLPDATMIMHARLEQADTYWYSHHVQRRTPVLRVGFDDPARTWFHIDPETGAILDRMDGSRRSYRWLFNALHSLDFPLLLHYRPAWDAVVWSLTLLGTIVSASGIVLGWRRLRRLSGAR